MENHDDFLNYLSRPAKSALIVANITTLDKLAKCSIKEILKLHGVGKASIPIMQTLLAQKGLNFKSDPIK